MSAHQRFCESNPKRDWYILQTKESAKKGCDIGRKKKREEYEKSLSVYQFNCERCGKTYSKTLSPKQYAKYLKGHHLCSKSCANSRTMSDITKAKISAVLKKHYESLFTKTKAKRKSKYCELRRSECADCHKEIFVKTTDVVYCYDCIKNHMDHKRYQLYFENGRRIISDDIRNKWSLAARKRVENGTHKGWMSRNITSYPERFWKDVLTKNNIKYEHNYPVKKQSLGLNDHANYFLDFKIKETIDLEIDGSQHKYRKERDEFRDKALSSHGWVVYRIEWNEINTENGKQKMKKKIDDFLLWYKSHS